MPLECFVCFCFRKLDDVSIFDSVLSCRNYRTGIKIYNFRTIASLMSAATIIGPPIMSSPFYYFTHKDPPFEFPGMPFIFGASLMMMSGIISYFSLKKYAVLNNS